jgi:hypothetical protein
VGASDLELGRSAMTKVRSKLDWFLAWTDYV